MIASEKPLPSPYLSSEFISLLFSGILGTAALSLTMAFLTRGWLGPYLCQTLSLLFKGCLVLICHLPPEPRHYQCLFIELAASTPQICPLLGLFSRAKDLHRPRVFTNKGENAIQFHRRVQRLRAGVIAEHTASSPWHGTTVLPEGVMWGATAFMITWRGGWVVWGQKFTEETLASPTIDSAPALRYHHPDSAEARLTITPSPPSPAQSWVTVCLMRLPQSRTGCCLPQVPTLQPLGNRCSGRCYRLTLPSPRWHQQRAQKLTSHSQPDE